MEGKLNIFGSNHSEVGSLSENLVLNTAGKVKIRFGQKFIDLIDDKGNINVKIPKVLIKVDSKDEIDSTGFYLLNGDLYVNIDGELIPITGVEEKFISYGIEQDLTQEQIELAQKNIGLSFPSIKDAQKTITKGIVFVDGQIYYINGGTAKEMLLNDPLISINDAGLSEHPQQNNSAILWQEGNWKYVPIITYQEFEDFKRSIQQDKKEEEEEEEESEEEESIFDPIQYSKVYTLKSFGLEIEEYTAGKFKAIGANFSTQPLSKLQNNDICIISVSGIYCTLNGNTIEPETKRIKTTYEIGLEEFQNESGSTDEDAIKEYCNTQDSGTDLYSKTTYEIEEGRNIVIFTNESDRPAEEIYTFNFRYKDGGLIFINKDGSEVEYPITEVTYGEQKLYVFTFGEDHYAVRDTAFNNKHLYVKAEQSKKEKFKIDYNNAEIALEENYPTNSEGETDKPKIIPHAVLGDLDDKSEYYNSPAKSFRTYKEKENSQGLFSDQAVFVGTEFRQPLDYKELEEEKEYTDVEVYNFPRYSKTLDEILCTKHQEIEDGDDFNDVIPTIRWIKNNSVKLNEPLNEINKIDSTHLEAETVEEKKIHIIEEINEEHSYVILSKPDGTWGFFNLGKWVNILNQLFQPGYYWSPDSDHKTYTFIGINYDNFQISPTQPYLWYSNDGKLWYLIDKYINPSSNKYYILSTEIQYKDKIPYLSGFFAYSSNGKDKEIGYGKSNYIETLDSAHHISELYPKYIQILSKMTNITKGNIPKVNGYYYVWSIEEGQDITNPKNWTLETNFSKNYLQVYTDVLGDWGNASFTIGNSLCEVNDNNEIISINPEGYIKAEGTVENWENSEWVKCFLSYIMSQFLYVNNKYYTKSGWVNMGYEVVRSNGYAGYWTGRINISSPNSDDPNDIRYKKALNFTILSGQVIQYGVCVQFEFTNVDVGELTNYVSGPFGVKVGDTGNYIRKIYKVDYGNLKYNINKLT